MNILHEIFDTIEDFLRSYFDKLLLTGIFVFLVSVIINYDNSPTGTWAQQAAGTILGALVMLITGVRKANGAEDTPRPAATETIAVTHTTDTKQP